MTEQHQVHRKNLHRRGPDWRRVRDGHECNWPGCERLVGPRLWGCKPHWFKLPAWARLGIERHYTPGQEWNPQIVSDAYTEVETMTQNWIRKQASVNFQAPDIGR